MHKQTESRRGNEFRRIALGVLAALTVPILAGAAHITPTVVIEKQAEVIRSTLPGATQYFLKTVTIGKQDLRRIEAEGDFEPDEPEVKFFYGEDGRGSVVGVVLFPQINTQHGPFEVGLTVGPDGTVREVRLTKATVETKPWVLQAASPEFLADFEGLSAGQAPERALARLREGGLPRMPAWAGQQVALAVERGLTLYQILYSAGGD